MVPPYFKNYELCNSHGNQIVGLSSLSVLPKLKTALIVHKVKSYKYLIILYSKL